VPESSKHIEECIITGFSSNDTRVLLICSTVRRRQRWNVDWIANRLVTRWINHVAQCLFGILYAATLGIAIPQVYQLLQLSGPQATNTFSIHLQNTENWQLDDHTNRNTWNIQQIIMSISHRVYASIKSINKTNSLVTAIGKIVFIKK